MINLREIITEEMLMECISLEVSEAQDEHIDDNATSMSLAWYHRDSTKPLCIYNDDEMVGFTLLYFHHDENECEIWQFMIDVEHQGKGYGKAAVNATVEYIKNNYPELTEIHLATFPENDVAIKMYEGCGFVLTDEILDDEEIVMRYIK